MSTEGKESKPKTTVSKKVVAKPSSKILKSDVEVVDKQLIIEKQPLAKAGKRSSKALAEDQEKEAKNARKKTGSDEKTTPKKLVKPPRSRAERAGKQYRKAAGLVEPGKSYALADAMELITKTSFTKFDATVEMHINLNVDPKQADQNIRETIILPSGSGKPTRVAVIAEPIDATKAKKAGADIAGLDEVFQQLDAQDINFDVLITTPLLMARLAKYAKILGPKGLMPNPKSGTVTTEIAKAVEETKSGKVEYRVDTNGIVHLGIGKISFGAQKLTLNAQTVLASLKSAKPASVKGSFIASCHLSSAMGPSIKLDLSN